MDDLNQIFHSTHKHIFASQYSYFEDWCLKLGTETLKNMFVKIIGSAPPKFLPGLTYCVLTIHLQKPL